MSGTIIFAVVCLFILLYYLFNRKKFEVEGVLGLTFKERFLWFKLKKAFTVHIVYFLMLKTQAGITFCKGFNKKHPKFIKALKWPVIVLGFIIMGFVSYMIFSAAHSTILSALAREEIKRAVALVLPINIQSKAVFYLPVQYWLVAVFITCVVHEFGHAIIATHLKLKIKKTGLAFMAVIVPLIPAAYVDVDMEALKKKKFSDQVWVLAAGSVFNVLFSGVILIGLIIVGGIGIKCGLPLDGIPLTAGPGYWMFIINSIWYSFIFCFGIGIMNLFPMLPLDGGHIIVAWAKHCKWKTWIKKTILFLAFLTLLSIFLAPWIISKVMG